MCYASINSCVSTIRNLSVFHTVASYFITSIQPVRIAESMRSFEVHDFNEHQVYLFIRHSRAFALKAARKLSHFTRLPYLASPPKRITATNEDTLRQSTLRNSTFDPHPQCLKQPLASPLPTLSNFPTRPSASSAKSANCAANRRPSMQAARSTSFCTAYVTGLFFTLKPMPSKEGEAKEKQTFEPINANATLPGLTPSAQPRRRDHRQGAK